MDDFNVWQSVQAYYNQPFIFISLDEEKLFVSYRGINTLLSISNFFA
jgi:hypothetical protein